MTDRLKHNLTNGTSTIFFRAFMTLAVTFIGGIGIKGCNDWSEMKSDIKVFNEFKGTIAERVKNMERTLYLGQKKKGKPNPENNPDEE